MLPRLQRILAGIELFALVLWVGGLFFFTVAGARAVSDMLLVNPEFAVAVLDGMMKRFTRLEIVFAVAILASNFVKVMLVKRAVLLQKLALMISALMLVLALAYGARVRPALTEAVSELGSGSSPPSAHDKLRRLRAEYEILIATNLVLGLFLVYAYGTYEDRKAQPRTPEA